MNRWPHALRVFYSCIWTSWDVSLMRRVVFLLNWTVINTIKHTCWVTLTFPRQNSGPSAWGMLLYVEQLHVVHCSILIVYYKGIWHLLKLWVFICLILTMRNVNNCCFSGLDWNKSLSLLIRASAECLRHSRPSTKICWLNDWIKLFNWRVPWDFQGSPSSHLNMQI